MQVAQAGLARSLAGVAPAVQAGGARADTPAEARAGAPGGKKPRLILNRIWGERPVAYRSWAVQQSPSPLARAFWRRYDVASLDVEPEAYAELLERRLEEA